MKILATSDLHGYLPEIPECDILLIGGDVCPMHSHALNEQRRFLDTRFRAWLEEIPAKYIVGIAGNHDFIFEHEDEVAKLDLPWIYLRDEALGIGEYDLTIYGIPWVPNLPSWAFHATREQLALRYDAVPKDTDIVLSHGPPWLYGDFSLMGRVHCGSRSAANMLARVRPRAFICGHIHEGRGEYQLAPQHGDPIDIYNVSYVSVHYEPYPLHQPIVEIPWGDDVMVDNAIEDSSGADSQVHREDSDSRQSSQSAEGSQPGELDLVDAAVAESHSRDPR